MTVQVRCPLCGMQVNLARISPRPVVAVKVTSKGDKGICHTIIDTPSYVLKRISQCFYVLLKYLLKHGYIDAGRIIDIAEIYLVKTPDVFYPEVVYTPEIVYTPEVVK